MTTGKCKHGEFELTKGCAQCIEERQAEKYCASGGIIPWPKPEPTPETALVIPPGADIEVMDYHQQALEALKIAEARVIKTADDAEAANDDLVILKKLRVAMEARRKEVIAPFKVQVDDINETYKVLMEPVFQADKITRYKMNAYDAEQLRRQREQEEINRMRMEAAQKDAALHNGEISESVNLVEVVEAPEKVTSTLGNSGMRDNWKYEVLNFALLDDAYKVADNAQLTAIARRHHDQKPVNGVRFYNEPTRVVRG